VSYADLYPYLTQAFDRIQSAGRVVESRLPAGDKREAVLTHLRAAEAALNELDDEAMGGNDDDHESHDDRRMNPTCRFCWPIAANMQMREVAR
jgi:hypothetical protein